MLAKYSPHEGENNYREAQKRIKEAMENGEKYVYLPGKNNCGDFSWCATLETISQSMIHGTLGNTGLLNGTIKKL